MDQISLKRKSGVEKKTKKGEDLVVRAAEIKFAQHVTAFWDL